MLDNQELRAAYIEELIRYAKTDDRITLVEADLSKALSSPKFKAEYPDRLIDVGICEANMIGVAAGLAVEGKLPFTHTFTPGITALLGPNGAGKSTLIHLICDLLPRQTGTIAFDGTDILSMGPAFRQVLGFMPQSQGMYDDMTAWEFLLYMAQLKGLRPRAAQEQLRELLQVVNLWDAAHRRVGGFSGGMRQRVMLAQALLGAPKVLLLDEPTAGLDPEERVRLREYIRQLGRDKIVLITTHITGDVESIASEILLLHHGVLLADAPAEEFIRGCGAANLEDAYIRRLHPHA